MSYRDSDVSGGKIRLKVSATADETLGADGLDAGELALNRADGVMYFKTSANAISHFPSASGIKNIVAISQAAYDALATKDSETLYVVT